jgi:hypothetical protein
LDKIQLVDISYPAKVCVWVTLGRDRRKEGVIEVLFDPPLSNAAEQSGISEATIFAAVITRAYKMVAEYTGVDSKDLTENDRKFRDMVEIIPQREKSFPETGSEGSAEL